MSKSQRCSNKSIGWSRDRAYMTGKQSGKPLSLNACVMTRLADKNHAKLGKILGLRAASVRIFFQPLY
jgi:hypothetical protein